MSFRSSRSRWWTVVAFGAVHLLTVQLGFALFREGPPGIVIWPAAGVAVGGLVAIKSTPRSVILAVIGVSTLVGDVLNGLGSAAALGYAVTELMGAGVGALVIDRTEKRDPFTGVLRTPWRTALGAGLGSATAAMTGSLLVGPAPALTVLEDLSSRFFAEFVGILIFAPALVAVAARLPTPSWTTVARNVSIGSAASAVLMTAFLMAGRAASPVMYLAFPALMLAAVFVGGRNLTVILAAVTLVLAGFDRQGLGPFAVEGLAHVVPIQIFYSILMLSTTSMAGFHRRSELLAEQLSQILSAARSPVIVVDDDERIDFVNSASTLAFGGDLVGRSLADLWGPGRLAAVIEAGGSAEIEADGEVGQVWLEVTADRFSNDEAQSYVLIARDLTERKRGERERRNLLAVVESSPDFIGFSSPDGTIRYLSPGARAMIGYGEGPVGQRIGAFAPEWAQTLIREVAVPFALEHGFWRGQAAFLDADEEEIPVSQMVMAHRNDRGEVEMLSTIAHDLRDRVRLEQDRQDLIDNAVHDLRNTLVAVSGAAEMLTGDLGHDRGIDHALVGIMSRGVTQLNSLIGDLVASKSDGFDDPGDLEPIDLLALAKQVVSLHVMGASKSSVSLVVTGEPSIVAGNRGQLHRLVENLVTNAVKYSPGGGAVIVAVQPDERMARLTVSDEGIGIDAGDVGGLFTRHQRASTARRAGIAGTGLGLAICKQIAEGHGGSIEVRSQLGLGSTFGVSLPLMDPVTSDGAIQVVGL